MGLKEEAVTSATSGELTDLRWRLQHRETREYYDKILHTLRSSAVSARSFIRDSSDYMVVSYRIPVYKG